MQDFILQIGQLLTKKSERLDVLNEFNSMFVHHYRDKINNIIQDYTQRCREPKLVNDLRKTCVLLFEPYEYGHFLLGQAPCVAYIWGPSKDSVYTPENLYPHIEVIDGNIYRSFTENRIPLESLTLHLRRGFHHSSKIAVIWGGGLSSFIAEHNESENAFVLLNSKPVSLSSETLESVDLLLKNIKPPDPVELYINKVELKSRQFLIQLDQDAISQDYRIKLSLRLFTCFLKHFILQHDPDNWHYPMPSFLELRESTLSSDIAETDQVRQAFDAYAVIALSSQIGFLMKQFKPIEKQSSVVHLPLNADPSIATQLNEYLANLDIESNLEFIKHFCPKQIFHKFKNIGSKFPSTVPELKPFIDNWRQDIFIGRENEKLQRFSRYLEMELPNLSNPDKALYRLDYLFQLFGNSIHSLDALLTSKDIFRQILHIFSDYQYLTNLFFNLPYMFEKIVDDDLLELKKVGELKLSLALLQAKMEMNRPFPDILLVFKMQEELRIAFRLLSGVATASESIRELTMIADFLYKKLYNWFFEETLLRWKHRQRRIVKGVSSHSLLLFTINRIGVPELDFESQMLVLPSYSASLSNNRDTVEFLNMWSERLFQYLESPSKGERLYQFPLLPLLDKKPISATNVFSHFIQKVEKEGRPLDYLQLMSFFQIAGNTQTGNSVIDELFPILKQKSKTIDIVESIRQIRANIPPNQCDSFFPFSLETSRGGLLELQLMLWGKAFTYLPESIDMPPRNFSALISWLRLKQILNPEDGEKCQEIYEIFTFLYLCNQMQNSSPTLEKCQIEGMFGMTLPGNKSAKPSRKHFEHSLNGFLEGTKWVKESFTDYLEGIE